MLAVLDRSQAVGFFEHSDEVTVIRKPDFLDDAFDGHVGAGQISAGAVKAHNVKVLGNGFAGVLFENAADVGLVVQQVFHQFFYAALNKADVGEPPQKLFQPHGVGGLVDEVFMDIERTHDRGQRGIDKKHRVAQRRVVVLIGRIADITYLVFEIGELVVGNIAIQTAVGGDDVLVHAHAQKIADLAEQRHVDHDIAVRTLAQVPNVSVNVAWAQKYHHSLAELHRFAAANVRDFAADDVYDFEVLVRVFVFVVRGRNVRGKVFVREQTLGDIARDHGFSPCDDRSLFSDYTTITISKSMKMST